MLSKDRRLTKKRDFSKLGTQGRSIHGPFATLRVRMSKAGEKRVAFITSTKVMKLAVDRNRAKRRMREVARKLWDELPDAHLLFILKSECKDVPYEQLVDEVRRLISKVPEAMTRPPKLSPRARKIAEKRGSRN